MFTRKHKNTPLKAPKTLWLKKSFDFVVPRSIEDCCNHIEELDQEIFSSYKTYLSSIDQKGIAFTVYKSAGRLGTVWAVGSLQTLEAKSTRIVGQAGIPAFDILFRVCVLGVFGIIAGLNAYLFKGLDTAYFAGFIFVLIMSITLGSLIWTRESLIENLK